ncbi:hypothetical protein BATDEDRAFT_89214 [Batrachochytrium dendrobatidis JAM81]|uniref:BHLH domain-containing protein n=1 Tax=Batrachochytrium dendrobatidis (strain JAM81 / FGSC 10211) TaxID=684364 RepID=F4P552_BATDJ|nr:uncharacterized protein BATDEDRAFT_89214 [Batrachochytrium dendrobatidis JAM81]EGF80012.1 hypothetical protein BATDEDRAFT_89214 [Batrachochytrium dendrobatidis JAM81]KAJ8325030.1 hypothetical protein O5D80_006541 [Batrachochytrium dendrobatidis]KAK5672813.1 hypothetical protein QVD99_000307 [Batrachochytrium dendrobatidis]|eukprot:XP_006679755.1 hypothetical protein BATDEDRAFT_89214 [Batrachochytrium dendrobatidis JAM81]
MQSKLAFSHPVSTTAAALAYIPSQPVIPLSNGPVRHMNSIAAANSLSDCSASWQSSSSNLLPAQSFSIDHDLHSFNTLDSTSHHNHAMFGSIVDNDPFAATQGLFGVDLGNGLLDASEQKFFNEFLNGLVSNSGSDLDNGFLDMTAPSSASTEITYGSHTRPVSAVPTAHSNNTSPQLLPQSSYSTFNQFNASCNNPSANMSFNSSTEQGKNMLYNGNCNITSSNHSALYNDGLAPVNNSNAHSFGNHPTGLMSSFHNDSASIAVNRLFAHSGTETPYMLQSSSSKTSASVSPIGQVGSLIPTPDISGKSDDQMLGPLLVSKKRPLFTASSGNDRMDSQGYPASESEPTASLQLNTVTSTALPQSLTPVVLPSTSLASALLPSKTTASCTMPAITRSKGRARRSSLAKSAAMATDPPQIPDLMASDHIIETTIVAAANTGNVHALPTSIPATRKASRSFKNVSETSKIKTNLSKAASFDEEDTSQGTTQPFKNTMNQNSLATQPDPEQPVTSVSKRKQIKRDLLTEDEKRFNHVVSEQKRRNLIRIGFQTLVDLTPFLANTPPVSTGPGNTGGCHSKSAILFKSADYIRELKAQVDALKSELERQSKELGVDGDIERIMEQASSVAAEVSMEASASCGAMGNC